MRKIVEGVVAYSKFRSDFEVIDLAVLDQHPSICVWYDHDYGTHLMLLKNINAVLEFQGEWLGGMKSLEGRKSSEMFSTHVLAISAV
ncbi:hypothetical protein [Paenibacillus sp. UNC496MF]|uniref:hypothetical protein n=1 Tax=Paenibacillus sp. UNC496MF TaxID=1502753 RepID=UPI000B847DFC|nr:hypothetical protein [Paenibacillus sp. UNC496MF]